MPRICRSTGVRDNAASIMAIILILLALLTTYLGVDHVDAAEEPSSPKVVSAYTGAGNQIILRFSEELKPVGAQAASQFQIYMDGLPSAVTTAQTYGEYLLATMYEPIPAGKGITVTYTRGFDAITGVTGSLADSFVHLPVQNGAGTEPPVQQEATLGPNSVTLVFNKKLHPYSIPNAAQFIVGADYNSKPIGEIFIKDNKLIIYAGGLSTDSRNVNVTYMGGNPALLDTAGNKALPFVGRAGTETTGSEMPGVSPTLPVMQPAVTNAVVNGKEIQLTFSQPIRLGTLPQASQFLVESGRRSPYVLSVKGGDTAQSITLHLDQEVQHGESVMLSFYPASGSELVGANGSVVPAFSRKKVINLSQTAKPSDTLPKPSEYEIPAWSARQSPEPAAGTPGDSGTNRYTLTAETVKAAYAAAIARSGGGKTVSFRVPDSEKEAIVALPLVPIEEAARSYLKASLVVRHKTAAYELPLQAVDFAALGAKVVKQGSYEGYLVIGIHTERQEIDKLGNALVHNRAEPLGPAVAFTLRLDSGNRVEEAPPLKAQAGGVLQTEIGLNKRAAAVVSVDPSTGMLTYSPTRVNDEESTSSAASFKHRGSGAFVIAKGAVDYKDTANHWARNDILLLANKYVVDGRTAYSYEPDKLITRGEFSAYIAKGLGLIGDPAYAKRFTDIKDTSAMAAYIGAAAKAGIVRGGSGERFQPNLPITREEIAAIAIRAAEAAGSPIVLNREPGVYLKHFKDESALSTWSRTDAAKAVQAGIINGLTSDKFGPKAKVTRAQAAVIIGRLLEYAHYLDR